MAERDAEIGLHNLKPAKGSTPPPQARRPRRGLGHGQDLGPRPEGRRRALGRQEHGRASRAARCPIHMRMRKLRGPHMKKSMPFEKFRTHTQPVNLEDLEDALRQGRRGHAGRARGRGLATRRGVPVKVLGHGRPHQGAHRARPRLLRHRAREDRGRRRHASRSSSDVGSRAQDVPQLLPGPRDPEEAGLHGRDAAALPRRRLHPRARHQRRRRQGHLRELHAGPTSSASSTSSPAAACSASRSSRSGSCPTSPPRSSCS